LGAREACGLVVLLSVITSPAHNGGAWVREWSTSRASCCKWIRTRASLLASSAHVRQCVESGQAWWGARRLADWSCAHCVLTGPVIMVARGCVGGPGRAQSCWKWIRARGSLLASSAHVFASAGSRGKRTGQCGQSGQAWLGAREASGVVVLLSVSCILVARGCAGSPGRGQVAGSGHASLRACICQCVESGGCAGGLRTGRAALRSHWPKA
jgi:hypothetical protein